MYTLKLENEFNAQLELTGHEDCWQVTSITGLNPPAAIISTSSSPNFDGEHFNNSRLDKRNIVISLVIGGNVELNISKLNRVIFPKRYIKVYYKTSINYLYAEGYVETFEYNKFENKVVGQISIICTDPYWKDRKINEFVFGSVIDLLEFPVSLPAEGISFSEIAINQNHIAVNSGNIDTGVEIEIKASHNVVDPKVTNYTTGESMTIRAELKAGDRILINTKKGKKSVRKDCDCIESNIINDLTEDSKWITLLSGENAITYSALYGVEYMTVTFKHRNLYGGV